MVLTGLTFAWRLAQERWGVPALIGDALGVLTLLAFVILAIAYLTKGWFYLPLIRKELQHPVLVSFFGTIPITLLLIPGILLPYIVSLACGCWLTGMVGMGMAWILPIVGTLDVSIIGYRLPIDIQPSQMILIGPFALAFSGYEGLTGSQDLMASILFYFALCLLMLFGSKIWRIPFCCPFRVTCWG